MAIRITFHGTLLALILLVLAMMAVGPARQLYHEESAIHADQGRLAAGTAETNRLTNRLQELQDPHAIEALARAELGYVRPGETSYFTVKPPAGGAAGQAHAPAAAKAAPSPSAASAPSAPAGTPGAHAGHKMWLHRAIDAIGSWF
ncbi:MAG TPA: septum formation initiator family protein [Actinomycetota bacterium]|nr:septum formation initiator family protein [Actinomycetota bacterium]